MTRPRIVAALVVILLLLGAAVFASSLESAEPLTTPVAEAPRPTTTTSDPDIELAVKSLSIDSLADVASELTYLSEPSTTTTTLPPSTTAAPVADDASPPATSPTATSPPKTSPPKTSPPTTAASDAGYVSGAEKEFASSINSFRSAQGLSGLSRSGSLDSYARSWAKKMAQNGGLSHSNIGSLLGSWSAVAENVGTGGSVKGIFDALKASSGHRSNMLGDYSHIGIGVWRDGGGVLWTAHVFAR